MSSQNHSANRRIVLAARPSGTPQLSNFRLEEAPVPALTGEQVLLRTLYLSLDPYMRQMMDEVGPLYSRSIDLGEHMPGSTVSQVIDSKHPEFKAGDVVLSNAGWQDYAISDGSDITTINDLAQPEQALGILGMPAFTAYVGLLDIGKPKPGETVVVAAATGAVGAIVGQIAKLKGARVVGIAGGPEKCRYAVEELGFDACLDRHAPELAERLSTACPDGIDVYFENVGGEVFTAVLPLLNQKARIPVIGHIADYNKSSQNGTNIMPQLMAALVQKRLLIQGLVILDHYGSRHDDFQRDMKQWITDGRIKQRNDITDGLENAPAAFIGLLNGQNQGKVLVHVADKTA